MSLLVLIPLEDIAVAILSLSHVLNFLQLHGMQHTRLPCPSLSPRVCSNSCPLSWWCHPSISSSIALSPPALSLSQHQGLFQWVSSHIRRPEYWSFSFSIISSNEYSRLIYFRMTGWIFLQSKELSRVFSSTTTQKHQFFCVQVSLWSSSHICT